MKNKFPVFFFLLVTLSSIAQQKDKKTIMAIFAHPDDEAVTSVTPILAKYATEGHSVYLVIATKGELGVNKHANIPAGDSLAVTRAGEAKCACEKLGIQSPVLLGLGDGSLAKDFTGRPLRIKLDSIFRLYQPDIVITWGPDGGYGHMDHRTVHNVVTELFQSGEYANPMSLYYTGVPAEYWKQSLDLKTPVKGMFENWKPVKKEFLTVRIKYSEEEMTKAIDAMYCHWSQFPKEQMNDIRSWMKNVNRDTVYLRPFIPVKKITTRLW